MNSIHGLHINSKGLPDFSGAIAQILDFRAFDFPHFFHQLNPLNYLDCPDQNGLRLSFVTCHYIKTDIRRHVNGINIQMTAVEPKIFRPFSFFVYIILHLLLYAWQALSKGALYAYVSTMTALIVPLSVVLTNTLPSRS